MRGDKQRAKSNRWGLVLLVVVATTVTSWAPLLAHPNIHEDRLVCHFAVGLHEIAEGEWIDGTHQFVAKVQGNPVVETHGPAAALRLDGQQDWLKLDSTSNKLRESLPTKELSVAAWVSLKQPQPNGGICGVLPDDSDVDKGWMLGYDQQHFTWGVKASGTASGANSKTHGIAYLAEGPEIERLRWYHVVGTYDGTTMQLYVNGQLVSSSQVQSGDIDYPEELELVAGAGRIAGAMVPLAGSLYEVKIYARVLTPEEITAVAARNSNLVNYIPPPQEKLEFLVQPYLQAATTTSMRILCETNSPARMHVDFAKRGKLEHTADATTTSLIQEVQIDNLEPYTAYFYEVTCTAPDGATIKSNKFSFQTAPGPELPWAFGVIGDTQRNPDVTRQCAEGLYALRPNFVLHCGDVVDNGFAKNQWLKDLFDPCATLFAHVPVFPVIGNHEMNSHWYYDYFSLTPPEYYYTFKYGNAEFFMIDSNKPLGPESEQFQWLEKQLAASTATWKFTCHHHPCFSSDENDYGDHIQGSEDEAYTWGDPNAQQLVPLYEKYGVDIAFNGHIHVYERTWPIFQMSINSKKGVRYITSGGGGGSLEQAAPQRSWFSLHFKRAHHYCYATIHDRMIQFKAYDIETRLFDTFELTKPEEVGLEPK